ncbi:zip metal ion transporter [Trichoderma cornu-damae]|uniref:Zip metal ion transporter n=1 Tax=Trichoderma cornu-damae TaxID=654480 RepID=A0A9P8QI99_9HYPO|nr:zip metal ion transporter [Trichoderma cornu-damae]
MELTARGVDNDTRGWILCIVSGIACVFGASVICVDAFVRLVPGKADFRIQDSNVFLACSLSLSFGVMLFSSLYSMLPESKEYFKQEGWSDQAAGLVMMGFFAGGFVGIQVVSRIVHQFMPSHVVDCDHSHDDATSYSGHSSHHAHTDRAHSRSSLARRRSSRHPDTKISDVAENDHDQQPLTSESTPLLGSEPRVASAPPAHRASAGDEMMQRPGSPRPHSRSRAATGGGDAAPLSRRPSIYDVQKRVMSFVKDTKCNCDESGSCYGYTDPCGQECFKHLSSRAASNARQPSLLRTTTGHFHAHHSFHATHDHTHAGADDAPISPSRVASRDSLTLTDEAASDDGYPCSQMDEGDIEAQHHHHVPANAFLSIGLQTSIAIALHKFPEGFITYATNHANPALGFNVFMALFVHNISEGFAMALPLYMALGSRWRAMAWSALLGGLSQPLGAAVAALWFKLANRTHMTPNAVAYACLFALTSGIMVSVGLQLFVESLSLNHNRNLCMFFAFLGMSLLGLSNALFAEH